MAATPFDSALLNGLFHTGEAARLFSDSADMRAMLIIEGALAKVQGAAGVIPAESAAFIQRSAMEVQIDPGGLARETATNGVCVPAFVAAFQKVMEAPEHSQYLHWGATSQDIIDTSLMLRLRQFLTLIETETRALLTRMADLADTHAALPMAARTFGQHAKPTSFGAVVAGWGYPLLPVLAHLETLRTECLWVSLSGAAGTGSELGPDPSQIRADLAKALGLNDPGRSWHTDRGPILRLMAWLGEVMAALSKIGKDLLALTQSGIDEVTLKATGASSTMPQKQNPVSPSAIVALGAHAAGLQASLIGSSQQMQRDGAGWFTEWLCVPQLCLSVMSALHHARGSLDALAPNPERMRAALNAGDGTIHAEALTFALAQTMPRPDAAATVKELCQRARETGTNLITLASADHPGLDPSGFEPSEQIRPSIETARAFSRAVAELPPAP